MAMDSFGGLGGLGGIGFSDVLSALGQSLLSSPRYAPFSALPQTMAAATQAAQQRGSHMAMVSALKSAGFDDQTAMQMALNPEAAKIAIQAKTQKENTALIANDPYLGGGGSPASAAPGAPSMAPRASAAMPQFAQMDAAGRIAKKLVDQGVEPIVAAGLVGQMGPESGFNTAAIGDSGTAFGLIQARGPRAEALKALAAKQGKPWTDEDVQVSHIVSELNGPEKAAYERAKQAKDASQAAYILAKHYERPAASAFAQTAPTRMALAQQTYSGLSPKVASNDPSFVPSLPPQRPGGLGGLGGATAPDWQTAQASPQEFDQKLQTARGGTAQAAPAQGVTPIPILPQSFPRGPATTQATNTIKASPYSLPSNPQEAYTKAIDIARRIQLYEARGIKVEGLKPILDAHLKLAVPTDIQRQVEAAYPGNPVAQTAALQRSLPNHTPTSIQEAEYVTQRPEMRDTVTEMKRSGAQNITTKVEGAGSELMMKKGIEAFDAAQDAAKTANVRTATLAQMASAAQGFQPGALAEHKLQAKRVLKDIGVIGDEGVSDAEAFQKAARKLQITAQPKGQGGVSNFERSLFAEAVPGMTDSPEGLRKAIAMATRLDDYDRKVAEIHRQSAKANGGNPNYLDVSERIAALGPPLSPAEMSALEAIRDGKPAAAASTAPAAKDGRGNVVPSLDQIPEGKLYKPEGSSNIYRMGPGGRPIFVRKAN